MVKKQINIRQLNNSLDEISALLLKLEDTQASEAKKVVTTLAGLLENISFPAGVNKQKNKLIKKLSKASDKYSDNLVGDVQSLLSGTINQQTEKPHEKTRSGLLGKLFNAKDNADKNNEENSDGKITGHDVVSIDTDDTLPINPDAINTSAITHLVLTEALRGKIAACKFNHQGQIIRTTMSCGISHYIENDDHESMFERADKALYAAKDNGRNQCMTASSLSE